MRADSYAEQCDETSAAEAAVASSEHEDASIRIKDRGRYGKIQHDDSNLSDRRREADPVQCGGS